MDVPRHDGDTLGVDGAEVGVLEETDKVCLRRLLQRHEGVRLESQVFGYTRRLEVQILSGAGRGAFLSASPTTSGTF